MKIEANLFSYLTPFFLIVAVVYGFMSGWSEPVGTTSLFLTAGLVAMVGWYLSHTAKHIDPRPEDDPEGDISQGAGDQGFYSPWSWWPVALAGSAAVCFLGLAAGWWIFYIGAAIGVITLVGWVMEYSRGNHAH